jgi:hypothetical protein
MRFGFGCLLNWCFRCIFFHRGMLSCCSLVNGLLGLVGSTTGGLKTNFFPFNFLSLLEDGSTGEGSDIGEISSATGCVGPSSI